MIESKSQIKRKPDLWESESKPSRKHRQQFSEDCMKVYCRIKPLTEEQQLNCMSIDESENALVLSNEQASRSVSKKFIFTEIFKNQSQRQIIEKLCDPIIESLYTEDKGALIFAYGVTNSGKTYTILGTKEEPGILNYLLEKLPNNIKLTPVQIYNEDFYSLTAPRFKLQTKDTAGFFQFKNYEPIVITPENKSQILQQCHDNRMQNQTGNNAKSSRSHAIFKIEVNGKVFGVVDLAGSERNKEGSNLNQTSSINKSLLCLGRCIQALKQQKTNNAVQIPYRQSKLTKALMEYFNPEFNLVMIVNINPVKAMLNETLKVLEYAALARDIKQNTTPVISRYKNIEKSKSKILVTLEECKSEVEYVPKSVKLKSKKCLSAFDLESREDLDEKYREFTDYLQDVRKQQQLNQYYYKIKANHNSFNFFYQENFKKEQMETDQLLEKLKSYRKSIKKQKRALLMTDTCVNTTPMVTIQERLNKKLEQQMNAMYEQKIQAYEKQLNLKLKQAEDCQNQLKTLIQQIKEDKERCLKEKEEECSRKQQQYLQKEERYNKRILELEQKRQKTNESIQDIKNQIVCSVDNKSQVKAFVSMWTSPIKFIENGSNRIKSAIGNLWRSMSPTKQAILNPQVCMHRMSFGRKPVDQIIQEKKVEVVEEIKLPTNHQQPKMQEQVLRINLRQQVMIQTQQDENLLPNSNEFLQESTNKIKHLSFSRNLIDINLQPQSRKSLLKKASIPEVIDQKVRSSEKADDDYNIFRCHKKKGKKSGHSTKQVTFQFPSNSPIANRLRDRSKKQF